MCLDLCTLCLSRIGRGLLCPPLLTISAWLKTRIMISSFCFVRGYIEPRLGSNLCVTKNDLELLILCLQILCAGILGTCHIPEFCGGLGHFLGGKGLGGAELETETRASCMLTKYSIN